MPAARPVCSKGGAACMEAVHHAHGRTWDHDGVQSEDGDGRGTKDLRETLADRGVPACLDQRALLLTTVPRQGPPEGDDGSNVGVPQLQPDKVVQHTAQLQSGNGARLESPKGELLPEPKTGGPHPRNTTRNFPANMRRKICRRSIPQKLFLHSFLSPGFLSANEGTPINPVSPMTHCSSPRSCAPLSNKDLQIGVFPL